MRHPVLCALVAIGLVFIGLCVAAIYCFWREMTNNGNEELKRRISRE
jgi:hypothetical protein